MFTINGIDWEILFVDENSPFLRRSNGVSTFGMTDGNLCTVFLSDKLYGRMLKKVLTHELCHCVTMSLGIYMNILQEEQMADFIATYGENILKLSDEIYKRIQQE